MTMLSSGDTIGITACSDALPFTDKDKIEELAGVLRAIGLKPVFSSCIFSRGSVFNGTVREKADNLMAFYRDEKVKAIFDISGGNLSNMVLEGLDYDIIRQNPKPFWGYSDLSAVINAIYAKTGNPSFLYQIRNLVGENRQQQIKDFMATALEDKDDLLRAEWYFLQGEHIEGTVVGGNIRCFLKLAGTPYLPDFAEKVLFLESLRGTQAQMTTHLYQLRQMGAFRGITGLLLGTFTQLEEAGTKPGIEDLVLSIVDNPTLPIAKTGEIGHAESSKCIVIGKNISIER